MAMPGTPLADQPPIDVFELVRLIAVTRLALPKARVRLAAGCTRLSPEGQALCFFAGANSISYGDKLLTADNPAADTDVALLRELGLNVDSSPRTKSTADTKEHSLSWICPTIQDLMRGPDYSRPENARLDYMPMPFDDKPTTPHQWPRQPWFVETGDVHGNGNLIIFTDGSVSDLKTVVGNQSRR
jgi:Biotin and Thiamin Synthesis associated domain